MVLNTNRFNTNCFITYLVMNKLMTNLGRLINSAVITLDMDHRVVLKQGFGVVDDSVRHGRSSTLD